MRWRVRAGFIVLWLVLIAVAMSARFKPRSLIPGQLSSAHSLLSNECERCHRAAESNPLTWALAPLTGANPYEGDSDSARCLVCHERGENAFAAHGLAAAELEAMRPASASRGAREVEAAVEFGTIGAHSELACGACHFEHRGRQVQLKRAPDHRCSVCHQRRFAGLGEGHPQFASYPEWGERQITFDHREHFVQHFKDDANAPAECRDCHALDESGRHMKSASFEQVCAACHLQQIQGSGRATSVGVPFLTLPGLDLHSLSDSGHDLEGWPVDADGVGTPFLDLLLAGDQDNASAIAIAASVDAYDLEDASAGQVDAVAVMANAVRDLLDDLGTRGQLAIGERLSRALGRELESVELGELSALMRPELLQELALLARGQTIAESTRASAADELVPGGGWYRDRLTIYYRISGHADRFMVRWLELARELGVRGESLRRTLIEDEHAVGLCSKCHGVELNWRARAFAPFTNRFTEFSHRPHLPMVQERDGCIVCHDFTTDPRGGAMELAQCRECHDERRDAAAGASCQLCHRYHVGAFPPALPATRNR